MRSLKILGVGCPKCTQLAANATQAAEALGLEYKLDKITDINEMMTYGVMITPALVIDGKPRVVGKVPTVDEIKALLA